MADHSAITYVTFFCRPVGNRIESVDYIGACDALKEPSDDQIVMGLFSRLSEATRMMILSKENEQYKMLFASRVDSDMTRFRCWTLVSVPGKSPSAASVYFDQSAIAKTRGVYVADHAGRAHFTITSIPLLFLPELLEETDVTRWEVDAKIKTDNSDAEKTSIAKIKHDTQGKSDAEREDAENGNHALATRANAGASLATQASAVSTTTPSYLPDYATILSEFRPQQERHITDLTHQPGFATLSPPDQILSQLTGCVKVEQYKAYKAKFLAEYRASVQAGPRKSIETWSKWAAPRMTLTELDDDEIPKRRNPSVFLRMFSGCKAMGEF